MNTEAKKYRRYQVKLRWRAAAPSSGPLKLIYVYIGIRENDPGIK